MGDSVSSPEAQGSRFEETFVELLTRVIRDDLKLPLLDAIKQASGGQGGKDVQLRWLNTAGRTRFWHFECKSHRGEAIGLREISSKLIQEAMAPHDLDVWCLALSDVEPSNEVDDLLNVAPQKFALDFALTVISPSRESIKWLYSCHPDLYRQQYGSEPLRMTSGERAARVSRFGEWLEEWSEKRPKGGPAGWTRITMGRIDSPPNDLRLARAYLRGLTPTCPWAAVVHDWSVPRHRVENDLLRRLDTLEPGFDYEWMISAGGEGKSTVLRRVAWKIASTRPEIQVLWADEHAPAVLPVEWLERSAPGTTFFLLVDGTAQFSGLNAALASAERLAERGVQVFLLMADRGILWRGLRARQRIGSRRRKSPLKLVPLSSDEQNELLDRLEAHRLLEGSARAVAGPMLSDASRHARAAAQANQWERSWLVPTILQLVDPNRHPFEKILTSVMEELLEEGHEEALQLLLAISLLHAAGPSLPSDIAERLAGSDTALLRAVEILDQELERQFDVSSKLLNGSSSRYVTHGAAVSDGFIRAACVHPQLRRWLEAVCRQLPRLMTPEYARTTALREDRFELLDMATRYLQEQRRDPELAAALLESWTELDPQGFVAVNRLGTAYLRWLQQSLREGDSEPEGLRVVANRSRDCFRRALLLAEEVLTSSQIPTPYVGYDLLKQQHITFNSWAVLEATLGTAHGKWKGDRASLARAAYLAILSLSLEPSVLLNATGLLSRILVNLDEPRLAAPILACGLSVGAGHGKRGQLVERVRQQGISIPEGGVDLLPGALEKIVRQVLAHHWSDMDVEPTVTGNQALLIAALKRISSEVPQAEGIEDFESLLTPRRS
jgi:hypothetical protein